MCAHVLSFSCTNLHTQMRYACARINAQPRRHTHTHNIKPPPSPAGPRPPHSHLLPSSTLLNFPAPALLSPFSLSLSFIFDCFLWDTRMLCRQVTRNNVRDASAGFALFWLAYTQEKVGSSAHLCLSSFQQLPKQRLHEFPLKLLSSSASMHLLRTVLFTHYARTETLWSRRNTGLQLQLHRSAVGECSLLLLHALCAVFVTKRIVPVVGSDCSRTHTCERITFHFNINLPTEIFHS